MISFLAVILSFSLQAQAGGIVGNGGDVIKCLPSPENSLKGLYSLDYLLFAQKDAAALRPAQSYQESLFRIRQNLALKVPELTPSFDEFTAEILNTDISRKHIWESTPYQLTEIEDEDLNLAVQIPGNCRQNQKIALIQAIIRQHPDYSGSNRIVYKYMPEIFESLKTEDPAQLSFLLVHEWLWSISSNVDRNRRINWFLHSSRLDTMSRAEILKTLNSWNLDVTSLPVIVDASGLGHFNNLQIALLTVKDGQTILLKEGVYTAGTEAITRPVTIQGDGSRDRIVIRGAPNGPVLKIQHSQVKIRNLTLFGEGQNPNGIHNAKSNVVEIIASNPVIESCRITSENLNFRNLIRIDQDASPKILGNTLEAGQGQGIEIGHYMTSAEITGNHFSSESVAINIGFEVRTKVKVTDNVFDESTVCPFNREKTVESNGNQFKAGAFACK